MYKYLCSEGKSNLGDVFEYNYGNGLIFNLGTQTSWKSKASILASEESLKKVLLFASQERISKIILPKIGAGLGGLKWIKVKDIIEKVGIMYLDINLFVVEKYKV